MQALPYMTWTEILEKIELAKYEGISSVRIEFKDIKNFQNNKAQLESLALANNYTLRRASTQEIAIWLSWTH